MNIAEKKQRAAVEEAMTKSVAGIKGRSDVTAKFDWEAYDGIDWAGIGRAKTDYYANEVNNIAAIGEGINLLCADSDYKEAFAAFTTIVYRSSNDDSIRLRATVSGTTLTFDNYTFGSTRGARDYEAAIKAVM